MLNRYLKCSLVSIIFFCTACAITVDGEDCKHQNHFVFGFAWLKTKKVEDVSIVVLDTKVLGVHASDQPGLKLGVGYSSSLTTMVDPSLDGVIAEVISKPVGSTVINIKSGEDFKKQ